MKTQHATGIKELCAASEDLLKQTLGSSFQQYNTLTSATSLSSSMTSVFQTKLVCWYSTNEEGEVLLGNASLYAASF